MFGRSAASVRFGTMKAQAIRRNAVRLILVLSFLHESPKYIKMNEAVVGRNNDYTRANCPHHHFAKELYHSRVANGHPFPSGYS